MNNQKPVWLKKSSDVSDEEYGSFYKSLTNDWDNHLHVKHFSAEGQIEYKALLYVPKKAPFDLFNKKSEKKGNIKLYVKRVFIMDKCDELIPEWLGFVSGVIDSDDLPLNVSREILQENKVTKMIKKNVIKKCIEMFSEMQEDDSVEGVTKYKQFYDSFQQSIKLGIHEDSQNRTKLLKLLMFNSLKSSSDTDKMITLHEYLKNMKDNQKNIYYITGDNMKSLENSPFVNGMKKFGFDVLYMTDPIDEYMIQSVREFEDKTFVDISKEGGEIDENDESFKLDEDKMKDFEKVLCSKMKLVLDNKIESVKISNRLNDAPCCISASKYGWSANMERIMKAQTLQSNKDMSSYMAGRRILELNMKNPIIMNLQESLKNDTINDKTFNDVTLLMYETALVASGFMQEDPSDFSSRIYKMISLGLCGDNVNLDYDKEDMINKGEEIDMSLKIHDIESEVAMEALD